MTGGCKIATSSGKNLKMPRIFDNIELPLLPALQDTLPISQKSDFCVGYFNLRGWRLIDSYLDHFKGGDGNGCRVLIVCRDFRRRTCILCIVLSKTSLQARDRVKYFKKKNGRRF